MITRADNCKQLQELHDRLAAELRVLKETEQEEEHEGTSNPILTVNIIKNLQKTLNTVELELEKCRSSH
jgi:hypothetical protein